MRTAGSDGESAVVSRGMAVRTEETDEFPGDEEGSDNSPWEMSGAPGSGPAFVFESMCVILSGFNEAGSWTAGDLFCSSSSMAWATLFLICEGTLTHAKVRSCVTQPPRSSQARISR